MDANLSVAESRLKLALKNMQDRLRLLEKPPNKKSYHYNRVKHTRAVIVLMTELMAIMKEDPDHWDDEHDEVPF